VFNIKKKEEDVVESLLDNEPRFQPGTYGSNGNKVVEQKKLNLASQQKLLGPTNMIEKMK